MTVSSPRILVVAGVSERSERRERVRERLFKNSGAGQLGAGVTLLTVKCVHAVIVGTSQIPVAVRQGLLGGEDFLVAIHATHAFSHRGVIRVANLAGRVNEYVSLLEGLIDQIDVDKPVVMLDSTNRQMGIPGK